MDAGPIYKLAAATRDHLRQAEFSSAGDAELARSFADDLDGILGHALPEQRIRGEAVRALRFAPLVLGGQYPEECLILADAASSAFGQVHWSEFYAEDEWSKPFLSSLAAGEAIGPSARLLHSKVILGLFLLGPETAYPAHAHPAEEFYLVLYGNPEFQTGAANGYEPKKAGSVVLHHSNISHSIRTSAEPFFGIYGWRGDIGARSWYRNDMASPTEPKRYPSIKQA